MKLSRCLFCVITTLFFACAARNGLGQGFTYSIDPNAVIRCESLLQTSIPSAFGGASVNDLVGANRFYAAGYTGQNTIAANVEAGLVWGGPNGHETMQYISNDGTHFYVPAGAVGGYDRHATWVGMMIGGHGGGGFQTGIAPGTDLRSGAIASSWALAPPNWSSNFNITGTSFLNGYKNFFTTAQADVINSSWGFTDTSGSNALTVALDGFAAQSPRTTFVASAGNAGPGANTVGGPASGWNGIAVGALANDGANQYNTVASFSSRGPQSYYDPVHGTVAGVHAAVDIVAPGDSLTSAYYGGATGGNQGNTPDGGPTYYSAFVAGTSFSAPITAGAVALLDSASKGTNLGIDSRDSRVIRAVLMNSADKNLPGWNNGQSVISGIITTTQSLDWTLGAGRLNLDTGFDQYLSGTRDVSGFAGGTVNALGWDFGEVGSVGSHNDYAFNSPLKGGTTIDVTLSWFRNRTVNPDLLSTTDVGFANLDLEVYDANFTTLIATSKSQYNSAEELHFTIPADGNYGLRVSYTGQMFGGVRAENYGLAWSATAVPEPAILFLLLIAAAIGLVRYRKRS